MKFSVKEEWDDSFKHEQGEQPVLPLHPVPRLARMLALAYYVERLIEQDRLRDYADAARHLGLTRARLTQIMNLLNLSPFLQAEILKGIIINSEHGLRSTLQHMDWKVQAGILKGD